MINGRPHDNARKRAIAHLGARASLVDLALVSCDARDAVFRSLIEIAYRLRREGTFLSRDFWAARIAIALSM